MSGRHEIFLPFIGICAAAVHVSRLLSGSRGCRLAASQEERQTVAAHFALGRTIANTVRRKRPEQALWRLVMPGMASQRAHKD